MSLLFGKRHTYIAIAVVVILVVITMIYQVGSQDKSTEVTTTVETGPVRQLVSVSGIAEAEQSAELAFTITGIVRDVNVKTGSEVKAGDVLVTLDTRSLQADRQDALAALAQVIANRDELLKGPTASARTVTAETLASKEAALRTTKENEDLKVKNAYHTLLSGDLTAYSDDPNEDAVPPVVSGTYTCDTEGSYTLTLFSSKSNSGYSFNLSGIENGTFVASTDQPTALGTCGLYIMFNTDSIYTNSEWHIDLPNTRSVSYITNRNAYTLAKTQAESAIALAEQAVALAKADAIDQNAPARSEAIARANAAVTQAQARLGRIDATIADRTLSAPFDGVITNIDILSGETVTTGPVVTLLASNAFNVKARIPEIDVSKISVGQPVEMLFDARTSEVVTGTITFISPQATVIDGVAYFEATINFTEIPTWMRGSLNADIDIIINEETAGLRIPKRFLIETDNGYVVLLTQGELAASTSVELLLEGNDGYVAITGVSEGDTLVAP